jgi:spermidine/putrescine transport system substrate-binding protein
MKLIALFTLIASGLPAAELHLYTWADYFKPELIETFEAEQGCRVIVDTFDSNEAMFAKLRAGATGYDVIIPSTYLLPALRAQLLITDLNATLLPNRANLDPALLAKLADKLMQHSVPYAISYGVLAYRKDKLPSPEASWRLFESAALKGKCTLLNDPRETLSAALKTLGHSTNCTDGAQLLAAADLVRQWKVNIARFDNEQYKSAIDAGEFRLVHGYSGDLFQVVAENPDVGILVPREGCTIACDVFAITKGAPQPKLAHAFVNFFLDAKHAAENMSWSGFQCPNVEALKQVDPEFLKNPAIAIPDEVKAKCEVIQDVGDALRHWTAAWDRVKE